MRSHISDSVLCMESGGQGNSINTLRMRAPISDYCTLLFYKEHIYKQPVLIFFKSRNQVLNLSDHKELKSFFKETMRFPNREQV